MSRAWQRRLAHAAGGGVLGGAVLAVPARAHSDSSARGRWAWPARSREPSAGDELVAAVAEAARRRGMAITAGLTLQDYHAKVPAELALPTYGRERTLAILLGSTREIWTPFMASLAAQPALLDDDAHEGPLNAYAVRTAEAVAAECVPRGVRHEIFYAHEMAPGRLVAVQHVAHAAGAAFFHQSVGLCVHPEYGPWHSYRALIVVDLEGLPSAGPPADPCDEAGAQVAAAEAALAVALQATEDASATDSGNSLTGRYRAAWQLWQRVRHSLTVGAEWAYEDWQDEYHYSHYKGILRQQLAAACDPAAAAAGGGKI
jgi:methylmalonic aciduria homocystinuria type C protein